MSRRVYVHIGLPKTGTTYLQRTLWDSRAALAERGVLLPGASRRAQRLAVWDLLGRRLRNVRQAEVPGAWQAVVEQARDWPGEQALLSEEFLVNARPRHVRRIVAAFDDAEVHVVVTVRDLARVVASMWQQEVVKSRTWRLADYVAAVRDPEHGPPSAGVSFWLRYDLPRILTTWEPFVAPERIHVVLVPPADAPPTLLLERFAAAVGIDPAVLTPAPPETNASLGVAETEVLRRVNECLVNLNERQYRRVVDKVVLPVLGGRSWTPRIGLPPGEWEWLDSRAAEQVEFLAASRYHVVGDLTDLRPPAPPAPGHDGDVPDAELLEIAVAALAATAEHYARLWSRTRRAARRATSNPVTRLSSARRAADYRVKSQLLHRADRNRLLATVVRAYLRRTAASARRARP